MSASVRGAQESRGCGAAEGRPAAGGALLLERSGRHGRSPAPPGPPIQVGKHPVSHHAIFCCSRNPHTWRCSSLALDVGTSFCHVGSSSNLPLHCSSPVTALLSATIPAL